MRASVPNARVTELKLTAISRATMTMTGTATGLMARCEEMPASLGRDTCESAMNIEAIAAMAATRLMVVTAAILPSSTRLRGAGVRSRLSSVLRSRSPAELSSAAEKPPVRIMVIRM